MDKADLAFTRQKYDAVLFDLDGVVTDTADRHADCWKRLMDEFLKKRAEAKGFPFAPFEIDTDYRLYVEGKPRCDGARDFLKSRGVTLPEGSPGDPPGEETVAALGKRKDELLKAVVDAEGVLAFEGSVTIVKRLRDAGFRCGVVSSSHACGQTLETAGIADLFEVRIDGQAIEELKLRGRPAPDACLEAARRLGTEPGRTVVVEYAISGVQAGRAGRFALVVGVARRTEASELMLYGADLVVEDLSELPLPAQGHGK